MSTRGAQLGSLHINFVMFMYVYTQENYILLLMTTAYKLVPNPR